MQAGRIDWDRVSELQDEVGLDDFQEVVDLFLEEVDEIVERLTNALDLSCLTEDLHFLKGSALNLGFEEFASFCAKGERMAAAGNAADVDVPQVLKSYQTSKVEFLEHIQNQNAA